MRDMDRKRAHDRARMARKYAEGTTYWQMHPRKRADYVNYWQNCTAKGATRYARSHMSAHGQADYMAEFNAMLARAESGTAAGLDIAELFVSLLAP